MRQTGRVIEQNRSHYNTVARDSKMAYFSTEKQYINELPENAEVAAKITRGHKHFTQSETEEVITSYAEQRLTVCQLAEQRGYHRNTNTISKLLKQNGVSIKPVNPLKCGVFKIIESLPGFHVPDDLGLVGSVDGSCQGIVVGIAHRTDRGCYACLSQTFAIGNGKMLHARIIVVYEVTTGTSLLKRHSKSA